MTTAKLVYKPQGPTLARFGESTKNVQILRGPLGAGKTIATAVKVFSYICNEKPDKNGVRASNWMVTRGTLPQLKSTTIRDWLSVVPKGCGSFTFGPPPEHRLDFDLADGTRVESNVMFIALDSEKAAERIRGANLTGAWANEIKQQPKSVIDTLHSRTGRFRGFGWHNWTGILADTNAWDGDHWLEKMREMWDVGEMPDWEFFVQPPGVIKVKGKWEVNPDCEGIPSIRESYYQKQMQGKKEDWIRVNLANEIGLSFDGKPVHPDYAESTHVAQENLRPVPGVVYVGLDFGLTPAAVFWQRQANKQWYGLEEIVIEDGDAKILAHEIKVRVAEMRALCSGELVFVFRGDPSGDIRAQTDSNTAFSIMRANGVPALPCSTNDPEIRRAALDRPLTRVVNGQPGLLLSPKMKHLRKALAGGFHYARIKLLNDDSRYRDAPVKDMYSHIAEAAEYGLMDAGEHEVVNPQHQERSGFPMRPVAVQQQWSPFD